MSKRLLLVTALMIGAVTGALAQDLYQVGDIVEFNGTKGYVYKVESNGRHGYAISLNVFKPKKYCTDKVLAKVGFTTTKDNGVENTQIISKLAEDNGKTLSAFPAYEWAKSLGEGWYIPSAEELADAVKVLVTAPAGEEDEGGEDGVEESIDQTSVNQTEDPNGINWNDYIYQLPKKSKKFANNTSNKFKEEGGEEYLKSNTVIALCSSTITSSLPVKYWLKASKEARKTKDEGVWAKYEQYKVPSFAVYQNYKPAAQISMWAMVAWNGYMGYGLALTDANASATQFRAIYKF